MISSDQVPPGSDWLVRRVVDLERQVREMQAGRRLEAATIGAGGITIRGGALRVLDDSGIEVLRVGALSDGRHGLIATDAAGGSVELAQDAVRVRDTAGRSIVELGKATDSRYGLRVNDADGDPQIRAGQLASGGYGLEAVDPAGKLVALSTLAFGLVLAQDADLGATSSTLYTNLDSPAAVGPSVTATIGSSGKCIVILSSSMFFTAFEPYENGAAMSFQVTGATSMAPADSRALTALLSAGDDDAGSTYSYLAWDRRSLVVPLDGLNPGAHTFTAKYRTRTTDPSGSSSFDQRAIAVLPY